MMIPNENYTFGIRLSLPARWYSFTVASGAGLKAVPDTNAEIDKYYILASRVPRNVHGQVLYSATEGTAQLVEKLC